MPFFLDLTNRLSPYPLQSNPQRAQAQPTGSISSHGSRSRSRSSNWRPSLPSAFLWTWISLSWSIQSHWVWTRTSFRSSSCISRSSCLLWWTSGSRSSCRTCSGFVGLANPVGQRRSSCSIYWYGRNHFGGHLKLDMSCSQVSRGRDKLGRRSKIGMPPCTLTNWTTIPWSSCTSLHTYRF